MNRHSGAAVILLVATVGAGCRPSSDARVPHTEPGTPLSTSVDARGLGPIAVSTSYLASAIHDLLGEEVPLVLLAEPGMCPGHFDLRPSQVQQLRRCATLVRFDFQSSLDARLTDGAPAAVPVTVAGGKCLPDSYISACRQLAHWCVMHGRLSQEEADRRLTAISHRIDQLNHWATGQISSSGLRRTPVLSSGHQAEFCRHLGLQVVGTFAAADTATPGQIDKAVKTGEQVGVKLIIANLPEGRQLADALAARLRGRVIVFGNFPAGSGAMAFDELVRSNVTSLVEAAE